MSTDDRLQRHLSRAEVAATDLAIALQCGDRDAALVAFKALESAGCQGRKLLKAQGA